MNRSAPAVTSASHAHRASGGVAAGADAIARGNWAHTGRRLLLERVRLIVPRAFRAVRTT